MMFAFAVKSVWRLCTRAVPGPRPSMRWPEKTAAGEADEFEDEKEGQSEGRQRGFEMLL